MSADPSRMLPVSAVGSGEAAGLRVDARHNRHRIVEVARTLFAERGLDVPMAAIARHAKVGVATLYRRFPTKDLLITEVFADQFAACVSAMDDAMADPDPWHGFCAVIEKVCTMQAVDRGFSAAFITAFPNAIDVEQERDRAMRGFAEVTERAKASGNLRADFAQDDLTLLLMANGGIITESTDAALSASRRLVAYLLSAFRADHADPSKPLPPPTPLSLHDIITPPTSSSNTRLAW